MQLCRGHHEDLPCVRTHTPYQHTALCAKSTAQATLQLCTIMLLLQVQVLERRSDQGSCSPCLAGCCVCSVPRVSREKQSRAPCRPCIPPVGSKGNWVLQHPTQHQELYRSCMQGRRKDPTTQTRWDASDAATPHPIKMFALPPCSLLPLLRGAKLMASYQYGDVPCAVDSRHHSSNQSSSQISYKTVHEGYTTNASFLHVLEADWWIDRSPCMPEIERFNATATPH